MYENINLNNQHTFLCQIFIQISFKFEFRLYRQTHYLLLHFTFELIYIIKDEINIYKLKF
jgi:hypothetical protein